MRRLSQDPAAALLLAALALVAGLTLGALVGYGARRPPAPVRCTSTLRIEPAGPGAWTLVCEGGAVTVAAEAFYDKLYRYFREGRAATDAWNEAYLRRNNLEGFVRDLEARGVVGTGDFGGPQPAATPATEAPTAERPPASAPAPSPAGPGLARAVAVAAHEDAPVVCECGLTVTFGGYLGLHRMGVVHQERLAARGGVAA